MRKLTLLASVAVSLLLAGCAKEQKETLSVIPVPLSADLQKGAFQLNDQTKLWIDAPQEDKTRLADYIAGSPFQLDAALEEVVDNVVILQQVDRLPDITSSEGYVLEVTPKQVKIRAASGAGLFYGVQTFLQMETVQFVIGKSINLLLHKIHIKEMTGNIEHHTTIGKARLIGNSSYR